MGKKKSAAQKAAAAAAAAGAPAAAPPQASAAAAPQAAPAPAPSSAAPAASSGTPATPASSESIETRSTSRAATRAAVGSGVGASGAESESAAAEDAADDASALPPVVYLLISAPNGKSVKVETTPQDCVLDVRQFLLEAPETAEYTCYHLEASFGILNDYLELQDYPQLVEAGTSGSSIPVVKIVPELYDERASRLHVRRFRELLVKPPAHIQPSAVAAGYENTPAGDDSKALVAGKKGGAGGKKGAKKVDALLDELIAANGLSSFTDSFSLTSFHAPSRARAQAQSQPSLVDSVRNMSFSGWNPPPGNRALQGDLLYLEITTLEGVQAHVTANQEGFYLNQSTASMFNPERAETHHKSLTLVELLKKLSPAFKAKYNQACQRRVTQHPFETMEMPGSNAHSHAWIAQAKPHTYDWNRAEDSQLSTFGMDNRGAARDWNEEYQSCRELAKSTPAERVLRDRTMYRVMSDYVDAATKGAVAVVHGHIPPVNPMDAPRSYVFIYNNIFFSFAIEGRELDEQLATPNTNAAAAGADVKVSCQMANQDLHGVHAYAELDIEDLHTLATVIVDYRGHRVLCQSIIPGIFAGDRASKHVYGSMNHGETIEAKPEFHAVMSKASEKLHLKAHSVLDSKGNAVELAACVESKGIIGSDGRNYVLDLLRVFPRDANFLENKPQAIPGAAAEETKAKSDDEHKEPESAAAADAPAALPANSGPSSIHSYLLRPELIQFYARTKAFETLFPSTPEGKEQKEKEDAERAEKRKAKLEQKAKERAEANPDAPPETDEAKAEAALEEERAEMEAIYNEALASVKFNPDSLTNVKLAGTAEEIAADEEQLRVLSTYLKKDMLQKVLTGLRNLDLSPVDTQHLTQLLHEHGINLRYLSSIISLAQTLHLPHIESMCIQECIVRSCKHIFNAFLRNITPEKGSSVLSNAKHLNSTDNLYFAPLIAKFLTSLFGVHAGGHKISEEQMAAAAKIVQAQREEDSRLRKEYNAAVAAAAAAQAGATVEAAEEKDGEKKAEDSESTDESAKNPAAKKENAAAVAPATPSEAPALVRDMVITLADGSRAPTDPLSPANLWQLIRVTVREKFGYDLPAYLPITARSKICMLRSFCLKTGVQLLCRDYDLAPNSKNTVPFVVSDILDLHPVVKAHMPGSRDARELLEAGTAYLTQGQFVPAYQLLSESLNLHHQVFGPMHVDTANVYSTLALTCYHAGENAQAMDFQQRAIIIYERVLGLDSFEVAHAHMHQALFTHGAGHRHASEKHIARALYLFELIAGPNHPDTAAAHMNAAMIKEENGQVRDGLRHLESALERNQLALGPEHVQVALSHHAVAVASALLGEFRNAVNHEKMAKSVYLVAHGNKHATVVRSHYWLEHFTALAVQTQLVHNKLIESKKKGAANAAAAANAAMVRALTPAHIIPPQLQGINSPFTWVSLHSTSSVKSNKLSMADMMSLLDATTRVEQAKLLKKQAEGDAALAPAAATAATTAAAPETAAATTAPEAAAASEPAPVAAAAQ